jgi:hypothetical protein
VRILFYAKITPAGHRLPVRGAKIRFAGHTVKTNRHGRAVMRVKFKHAGRKRATARRSGLLNGTVVVRVRRPKH